MTTVAGIDVGWSAMDRTTGICRAGTLGFGLGHAFSDRASRLSVLGRGPFDVLAIDAPLMPHNAPDFWAHRACEHLFMWGAFQKRCKPGDSTVRGSGQALRRSGAETLWQLRDLVSTSSPCSIFPRVSDVNVAEAFPNAFLGVLLEAEAIDHARRREAGARRTFDRLYDLGLQAHAFERLRSLLGWEEEPLWSQLSTCNHHEERSALICALTAICICRGLFTAIGDPDTGYFFLPPLRAWAAWASAATARNLARARMEMPLSATTLWADGARYSAEDAISMLNRDGEDAP
jgi:predicted nuclease with RNAse H fold